MTRQPKYILTEGEVEAVELALTSGEHCEKCSQKGCVAFLRSHPYQSERDYQNGFNEGFEIGKAQCETHHEDIKEEAIHQHQSERDLWTTDELIAHEKYSAYAERKRVLNELKKKILSNTTDPEHAGRNGRYLKQCVVMVTDIERIFEELREKAGE